MKDEYPQIIKAHDELSIIWDTVETFLKFIETWSAEMLAILQFECSETDLFEIERIRQWYSESTYSTLQEYESDLAEKEWKARLPKNWFDNQPKMDISFWWSKDRRVVSKIDFDSSSPSEN